jgi:very-short-patch-repair endonuclease
MRQTSNDVIVKARELRRSMSLPEGLLWRELRKRPGGFKFPGSIRSDPMCSISSVRP